GWSVPRAARWSRVPDSSEPMGMMKSAPRARSTGTSSVEKWAAEPETWRSMAVLRTAIGLPLESQVSAATSAVAPADSRFGIDELVELANSVVSKATMMFDTEGLPFTQTKKWTPIG